MAKYRSDYMCGIDDCAIRGLLICKVTEEQLVALIKSGIFELDNIMEGSFPKEADEDNWYEHADEFSGFTLASHLDKWGLDLRGLK